MRDIASSLRSWRESGTRIALARVMATWGSAPRRPGAALGVTRDISVAGSLSGGCIEAAVIEEAVKLLKGERTHGQLEYGVDDETAWSTGLSCGGRLSVYLEELPFPLADAILRVLDDERPVVWLTMIDARHADGSAAPSILIDIDSRRVDSGAWTPGSDPMPAVMRFASSAAEADEVDVNGARAFAQMLPRPDELVIVGAGHIAQHLVPIASELGFRTVVIDPRRVFANRERFPIAPDELIVEWPDTALIARPISPSTYTVLLSHDPKLDDAALSRLLGSDAAYIGALGSSRTQQRRRERLSTAGFAEHELGRIRGPAGVDIGAATPAEIAVAIMAQIVEAKRRPVRTLI